MKVAKNDRSSLLYIRCAHTHTEEKKRGGGGGGGGEGGYIFIAIILYLEQ